ncbi:MAG: AIR synthase-related protein [Nanoarchaeota archaeon]
MNYNDAGIDRNAKRQASEIFYEASKKTWSNRKDRFGEVAILFDNFSGLRSIKIGKLSGDLNIGSGADGTGTKLEVAQMMNQYDTVAYDLFAMICDDAIVRGAEPFSVLTNLNVRTFSENGEDYMCYIQQLADGMVNAAQESGVAVINGEIADMPDVITGYSKLPRVFHRINQAIKYAAFGKPIVNPGFHFDWNGVVNWVAREDRLFSGLEIKAGDKLVALKEHGFRSNGLTLARKILAKEHGKEWHKENIYDKTLGEQVLLPSKIYCKAVSEMLGGYDKDPKAEIHGIAHITGEGIPGKLGRILKPSELGAYIDSPFYPCKAMLYCQEKGHVNDIEAYNTWNMGQGMIIITPSPNEIIKVAENHSIRSKIIGEITTGEYIVIKSQGFFSECQELYF